MTPPKTARPRWRVSTRLWRRLLTRLQRVSRAAVAARLGSQTKERRNGYLRRFLEVLAKHGSFAWGGSVAYSLASIARTLTCCQRTAERIVGFLRQMPELVHVRLVPPGELAWDGEVSSREHNEFTRGPIWRETVEGFEAELEEPKTEQPPRETPRNSKGFLRPMADITSTDPAKSSNTHFSKFSPSSMDCEGSRARGKKAEIVEKGSFRPLAYPERPKRAVDVPANISETIVQHRRIAEGKGPGVPILESDVELVRAALATLPPMPEPDSLQLCEQVSRLALEDAQAKAAESGKPRSSATANLQYTFAGKHFSRRVERLKVAAYVSDEVRSVIEQHRKIAEGKGPGVPISREETDCVEAALAQLPQAGRVRVCAGVSRLALEAAQAAGKTANINYTFMPKYFLQRVARLRELEHAARKARYLPGLQKIADALFPKPKPAKGPNADRPRWRVRTRPLPPPPADTDPELIRILEETRNNLANRGWAAERAGEQPEQEPQQAAPEPPQPAPEPPQEPPRQTPPEERQRAVAPQERRAWLSSLSLEDKIAAMEGRLTMPGTAAA